MFPGISLEFSLSPQPVYPLLALPKKPILPKNSTAWPRSHRLQDGSGSPCSLTCRFYDVYRAAISELATTQALPCSRTLRRFRGVILKECLPCARDGASLGALDSSEQAAFFEFSPTSTGTWIIAADLRSSSVWSRHISK
jgi:hypothetical protein